MSIGRKIGAVGLSAGLAVSLSLLPVLTDTNHADTAYAKGEGGGNGGGNGGGHGGGHGSGNGGNKGGNSSHSGMRDSHRSSAARSSHHRADPITKSGVTGPERNERQEHAWSAERGACIGNGTSKRSSELVRW